MPANKITWSAPAKRQIGKIVEYIRQDSVQNAEKVYAKLLNKLDIVAMTPETCPPDKYKTNNNGTYRAFVLFNYRVSYRIKDNEIRILRFRHTKMKTKYY